MQETTIVGGCGKEDAHQQRSNSNVNHCPVPISLCDSCLEAEKVRWRPVASRLVNFTLNLMFFHCLQIVWSNGGADIVFLTADTVHCDVKQ